MKINVLEPSVYNRISAGEVVERPASIVKELVENSIDAGASVIRIEITSGGIKDITISDDGCGIEKDDLFTAFLPHATSKIKDAKDLDKIVSLGFRGEALASISSVCQVKLSSKTSNSLVGYSIKVDGGEFGNISEIARSNGTTISCSNLFFNTPVRAKFLRKPKTEEAEITHLVEKFMLSNSKIAFQYYVDGKLIYNTVSCSMSDIIYTIYGNEVYQNLVEVRYEEDGYLIYGYVTKPKISKSNRTYQTLFVNGRCVENSMISSSIQDVFSMFLMKGRFPVYVLSLQLPPDCVDVNVHPSKKEVRFENTSRIYGMFKRAIEKALFAVDQIQNFILPEEIKEETIKEKNYKLFDESEDKENKEDLANNFKNDNLENYHANENIINKNTQHLDFFTSEDNASNNCKSNKKQEQDSEVIIENSPYNEKTSQSFGRSFSLDLFDRDEKFFNPQEIDLVIEKVGEKVDSNTIETEDDQPINEEDLEKISVKDKYIVTSKSNTTFFFDQSGEQFTNEIKHSTQNFLKASVKDEMNILGTIFKTYIVIELDDAIYFIDQHAGHERLLYDKLVKSVDENNSARQTLLIPYTFSVGAKESQQLDQILDNLKNIGFDIANKGYDYTITSVPYLLSDIDLSSFVEEIISESVGLEKKASDFIHAKLCQSACKHAIKAGDSITKDECAYIIEQVRKGVMLCPHGRPITLVITKHEFEKMFKRIV